MITDVDVAHQHLQDMISDTMSDVGEEGFTDDMVSDLLASLSFDCDDDTILELARRELGFYPVGARVIEGSDYIFMGY